MDLALISIRLSPAFGPDWHPCKKFRWEKCQDDNELVFALWRLVPEMETAWLTPHSQHTSVTRSTVQSSARRESRLQRPPQHNTPGPTKAGLLTSFVLEEPHSLKSRLGWVSACRPLLWKMSATTARTYDSTSRVYARSLCDITESVY